MKGRWKIMIAAAAAILCIALPPTSALAAPQKMLDGGIFDADYYAAQNPDVVENLGTSDANALYAHYLAYGKAEGRLPYDPSADVSSLEQTQIQQEDLSFVLQDGTYYTFNVTSDPSSAESSLLADRPVTDDLTFTDTELVFTGCVQEIYRDVTSGDITGYGQIQESVTYIMPLSDSCTYTCYMQDDGTVESTLADTQKINSTLLTCLILAVEDGQITEVCSIPFTLNE